MEGGDTKSEFSSTEWKEFRGKKMGNHLSFAPGKYLCLASTGRNMQANF